MTRVIFAISCAIASVVPLAPTAEVPPVFRAGADRLAGAATGQLVLRGGTLIDGTEAPPRPNMSVVVRDGWIVAVGPDAEVTIPSGARVVDLSGQYLLPGFVDMHAHLAIAAWEIDSSGGKRALRFPYDEVATRELSRSQLAFGITSARNPAGPTAEAVSLRNRIRMGVLEGPRIFTAGWPLDGAAMADRSVAITSEAAARAEVDRQAAAGVDYVKLYAQLGPAEVRAGIDEAHRLGIRAIAHLWKTSWTDAALAGVDGIVHISPGSAELLPEAKRAEYAKSVRGSQFMFEWFRYVDFDGAEIRAMLAAIVGHRVAIDPTLVAFEMMAHADEPRFYPVESARYLPPTLARKLGGEKILTLGWTPADFATARELFPRMLELARRLHDAGVLLTVGTDASNPWLFHRELELLVSAGIAPAEVIRMATRNAAMSLGIPSEAGTVEVGKRADLVVLGADPLADIRNSRRIVWVVQNGRLSRPEAFLPERLRTR